MSGATQKTEYNEAFAAFYDDYCTAWTVALAPDLVECLGDAPDRSVLELCCGTGLSASVFGAAGWRVVGVDGSPGMLALAHQRLGALIEAGRSSLVLADARDFALAERVGACVCLDGALNHLESIEDLKRCFGRVAIALRPGGRFVFDVFEPAHFRHWNRVTLIDEPGAIVAKRGAWDETAGAGMLRISGALGEGPECMRVEQTLRSRCFPAARVTSALEAAGFSEAPLELDARHVGCRSGACDATAGPCRTFYSVVKRERIF